MEGARCGQAAALEDIAGAKHWDNLPDQGFTVYRPKMYERGAIKTEVNLYSRKARFDELAMRWGMPPPPRTGGPPVTNIRNTSPPHWRGWLKVGKPVPSFDLLCVRAIGRCGVE
jgi:putative SOS response-associated peptidase YedK